MKEWGLHGIRNLRWDLIPQRTQEIGGNRGSGYGEKVKKSLYRALNLCWSISTHLLCNLLDAHHSSKVPFLPHSPTHIPPPAPMSSLKGCRSLMQLNPTGAEVPACVVYTHGSDFWITAWGWNCSQIFPVLRETPQHMSVSWNSALTWQCCKSCFSLKLIFFYEISIGNGTCFWVVDSLQ